MSNSEIKTIKREIIIPRLRLWVIWFLIVVLPSVAGLLIFKFFNKEYAYFSKTELISNYYDKIDNYNHIIAPENYMTSQLVNIQRINAALSPESIKSEIDQQLCGETMFCAFFDEKIEKITTIKSIKSAEESFRIPPVALIKTHIKNLVTEFKGSKNSKKITDYQHAFGPILQQLYKTATTINVSADKVSKNFSVKYGGELYFGFCCFEKPVHTNIGFFFVMRGRDFNFRKMLEKLHVKYPNARIIFKEMDFPKLYNNPENFYSGLKTTNGNLCIISPISMSLSRHILHNGTENFDKRYKKLMPFIEFTIPIEKLYQKQNNDYKKFQLFAFIIIIISGIYCLHIHLFGFDKRLNFKHKILLLALISSIFPFSLFCISVYSINHYNRFINELSIRQHASTELQIYNLQLEQNITRIESDYEEIVSNLTTLLNNHPVSKDTIENYLVQASKKFPVTSLGLFFKTLPEELKDSVLKNKIFIQFPERLSSDMVDENTDATFSQIPFFALESINDNLEMVLDRERRDHFFIGSKEISIEGITNFLENDSKLNQITNGNAPIWFSSLQIANTNSQQHEIIAILVSKFEPRPLIAAYIDNSFIKKKNFKEIIGNYEINYSFLPTPNSGSAECWQGSGNISESDKKLCLSKPTNETIDASTDTNYKQIIKNMNQLIPHLAVAIITERNNANDNIVIILTILSVIIFLSLILYLTSKMFDLMFGEPVNALASSAVAIAIGSENWEADIKSGDEFEALNNDFKHLVTSLKERNLLKTYLSEDAFSDIEGSNSLNLLPGGEYREATIVFSAIKDYEKITDNMSPDKVITLLSKYISLAEESSKTYGGSLDKILGDTTMLVFRDDPSKESHGLRAAKAALDFVAKAKEADFPGLYTGIASGTVISGKIGSYSGKLDFTVIGNPVNLAARLKAESKKCSKNTGIIISGMTLKLMKGLGRVNFIDRVSIKGKARKYNIYELEGLRK